MDKVLLSRIILLLVLASTFFLFFTFDLQYYFTLEQLKTYQAQFDRYYQAHVWRTISLYMVCYVVITACSLPGAAVMTLAGGALFGLWLGLVLVSFASTIGATCAFLIARFVFRDAVQHHFRRQLTRVNQAMEKEGAFYLFTLRMIPLFPFFVINVVMALTSIRTVTFFWVSQIGMLLGTLAYVNAGTQLAKIEQLNEVLSPSIILSFILIGLVPLIAKRVVNFIRRSRFHRATK